MSDQADAVTDPMADLMDSLGDEDAQPDEELSATEPEGGEEAAPEVEEEAEQPAEPQKFRVKVKNAEGQDEEQDLSLEELAQGYMLQSDYTRKTQAIAQEKAQVQQQIAQEVARTQQSAAEQITQLQELVVKAAAPELNNVDWTLLAAQDPAEYVRLQARHQQLNQLWQVLEAQKQQAQQQAQMAEAQQRDQAVAQSAEYLKTAIKGFDANKYQETLSGGQKHYGFAPQELAQVVDGRMVHVLHDALQWRQLQAQKPQAMKKVAEAPKVIKPSAPQPKNRGGELTKRLQKTGRVEDLAAFL